MRTMYDSVKVEGIPAGATMVAGYVDGLYANTGLLRKRFPHAVVVGIAVSSHTDDGQVLDVETGDATPEGAVSWVQLRRRSGADPTVYCNTSTWPAVRAAFKSAGVAEPHYWIAQWDNVHTIPSGAVAKQFTNGKDYDTSIVADYWPGVDSKPVVKPPANLLTSQPGFGNWSYRGDGTHDAWWYLNDIHAWVIKIAEHLGLT